MSPQCSGGAATCGQWEEYPRLDISCKISANCFGDEIGHAALIPTGNHKGRVLLWTSCDHPQRLSVPGCGETEARPFNSHILDPMTMGLVSSPSFDPVEQGPDWDEGPFCSGHTWILDSNENLKFLVVGGNEFIDPPTADASPHTFWFDPLTDLWDPGPGILPDLEGMTGSWYPSVITFLEVDSGHPDFDRFRPIAIGGTKDARAACEDMFKGWWKMGLSTESWEINAGDNDYKWHTYPRTVLLSNGEVFAAGLAQSCDTDPGPSSVNPSQKIDTSVNPQIYAAGPDPNAVSNVGAWNYNNAIIMHTLESGWAWDSNPATAPDQYDLDRVIATMGSEDWLEPPDIVLPRTGLAHTLEFDGASWTAKTSAPRGRAFSNAVLLPDGKVLVVGGQDESLLVGGSETEYYFMADRFDPEGPLDSGTWTELASTDGMPRGYHSVAILLSDASVLLMGGHKNDAQPLLPDPEDTVDHFEPPYLFQGGKRPVLKNVPGAIEYGQTFSFCVRPHQVGNPIVSFCLISVGSVTHHFDYGQRYVELLFHPGPGGCAGFDQSVELLAPPEPAMAPEGYYLLFGVDNRGVPSKGKFVKLTF